MKTLKSPLYASLLLALTHLPPSETFAQANSLPPGLNQNSTVQEILEYLDKSIFPHARIGLKSSLPGDTEFWDADAGRYSSHPRSLIFSQGFKLASGPDDCHVRLRNDDVKVYDADIEDVSPVDLGRLTGTQPPYAAEFSTWLETVSHDKGKAPFSHTGSPEKAKLHGAWRTEFQSRGFFTRTVFGAKFPALRRGGVSEYMNSNAVTFTFDDRLTSERFDAAFRRLIKLCQPRSTKWS